MSAQTVVATWLAEREAALQADLAGAERPLAPSVSAGSWEGTDTLTADLQREARVLRFLAAELERDGEVEATMAAAPTIVTELPPRSAAKAMLRSVMVDVDGTDADAILDALGWPDA